MSTGIYERVQQEFACSHTSARLTVFTAVNGAIHYRLQCERCGESVKSPKIADLTPAQRQTAPAFDKTIGDDWRKQKDARFRELLAEQQAEREAEREEQSQAWWTAYNAYLETDEWRQRRAKVLKRAGGICEGCRKRPATQVHHLTYDRVRNEMLFDLVAVCGPCHSQIHADGELADPLVLKVRAN